jgi:hypothetical protein
LFLNHILDEYKEVDDSEKDRILNDFIGCLWNSKCFFRKYKRYYTYDIREEILDGRRDLIELFNKYTRIEYNVCQSYILKNLSSVDYIRIHINNMYGLLFDKDVYYDEEYYKLLKTPKNEYFKVVKYKKEHGNVDNISIKKIKINIDSAFKKAEIIKQKSIDKKHNIKFEWYKNLINSSVRSIFNNYISVEEYENKYGWDLDIIVDGWHEDNYIISYFCKSLTGYMRNYIRKIKTGKYRHCVNCGLLISPTNNKMKYCQQCAREAELEKYRRYNIKRKYKNLPPIENPPNP